MKGETVGEDCILTSFELYEPDEFRCLEYNTFSHHLLATGGKELYIVNFKKGF